VLTRSYRFRLGSSRLAAGEPLLDVRNISMRFGGVNALSDVSLSVAQDTIHAVIGPNGAGKSSLLNCISGLYKPQAGRIELQRSDAEGRTTGHDLVRLPPHRIARLGVARSFQNIELFAQLTTLENLMLGRHVHMKHGVLPALLWFGPARNQELRHRELVEEVIDLLQLQSVRHQSVGSLAYGVQKRVELGRALCMQPSLLLLDEPMAGMNTDEKEDMARYILDVHELAGLSVVLIEHDMNVVMDISDRITVLDFGKVIADGDPETVKVDPDVIRAYLGTEDAQ
jgi:branched-chain amino acid transport system ATP-binding protein